MITNENKETFLFSLDGDTITSSDIYTLFNKKIVNTGGKKEVLPALYDPSDSLIVHKGQLSCIKSDLNTTVGRYIFNLVTIQAAFNGKIEYYNNTFTDKNWDKFHDFLIDELLMKRIDGSELGKFHTRIVWLNNFTELIVPAQSENIVIPPKEIKDYYIKLCNEHKDIIENNDAVRYNNEIEKPALDFAKKWYKEHAAEDPSWAIFAKGGKPKFDNVFKNCYVATGVIKNIVTGKNEITTHAYGDGIDPTEQTLITNQGIAGVYARAVNTQKGGAKTKEFAVAFQSQTVTEDDCGSKYTLGVDVTADNLNEIKWRYAKNPENPEEYIVVTPDNMKSFIGKHLEIRSPMLCMSDNYCWKCVGELYRRMGLKNCGLGSQKLTSTFLNKSLKAFHDMNAKSAVINWKDNLYKIIK